MSRRRYPHLLSDVDNKVEIIIPRRKKKNTQSGKRKIGKWKCLVGIIIKVNAVRCLMLCQVSHCYESLVLIFLSLWVYVVHFTVYNMQNVSLSILFLLNKFQQEKKSFLKVTPKSEKRSSIIPVQIFSSNNLVYFQTKAFVRWYWSHTDFNQ